MSSIQTAEPIQRKYKSLSQGHIFIDTQQEHAVIFTFQITTDCGIAVIFAILHTSHDC